MVDAMIEASPKASLLYLCNCHVHWEFYWKNNKAHVHKLASLLPHSTSHCVQCLWGLRIMDDWRGERESNGLCLCMKGETCWQCGKEKPAGLLELGGRMPASSYATGTCWPVRVCTADCVHTQNSAAESLRLVLRALTMCSFYSSHTCETTWMCFSERRVWEVDRWRQYLHHIQCDL